MNQMSKSVFIVIVVIALLVASCVSGMAFEKFSHVIMFDVSKFISNSNAERQFNKYDTTGFVVRRSTGIFSETFEDVYMFATLQEQVDCTIVRVDIELDPRSRYDRVAVYCE